MNNHDSDDYSWPSSCHNNTFMPSLQMLEEAGLFVNDLKFFGISVPKFGNTLFFLYLCSEMIVTFVKPYLQELYVTGQPSDKKHRFQP